MPAVPETLLAIGGWQAHDLIAWLVEEERRLERAWWDAVRYEAKYLHEQGCDTNKSVARVLLGDACRNVETHRAILFYAMPVLRRRLGREWAAYRAGMEPVFESAKHLGGLPGGGV